jgi:hypothetical protein
VNIRSLARAAALHRPSHRTCLPGRILLALTLASAVGWLFGCGVQGTPRPPQVERPVKITNLTVMQVGQNLEMHFALPQQTTEGERLTKPLEIEILRAIAPQTAEMAKSKLPEPEIWTRLTRDEWAPYARDNVVSFSEHLTGREFHDWQSQTLVVTVRTLTRGFHHRPVESDSSNYVDVGIYDVSEAVENVKGVLTEKAVELQFSAPARTLSGAPIHNLAGYRIYRSSSGESGPFELLGEIPTPPYRDAQFEFGKTYYYQVSAVFGAPGHPALSEASSPVKVVARDIFPPAAPQGLEGLYSAGAVELVWTANTEADLAGYNVYRLDGQPAQKVNKELVRTPQFRDTSAAPGKAYTYYVTAVDQSGNESKPSQRTGVEAK